MIKSAIALAAAAPLIAAPALAGSYYVQAGPAVVAVDGEETDTQFSGKAGLGFPVTDALSAYGEVSFLTAEDEDDFGLGGKLGVKFNF